MKGAVSGASTATDVLVTLDVFSGVPNPRWLLTAAQAAELAARLSGAPRLTGGEPPDAWHGLGYRGLWVQRGADTLYVYGGTTTDVERSVHYVDEQRELERWLLASAPSGRIPRSAEALVHERLRAPVEPAPPIEPRLELPRPCFGYLAPRFTPHFWNSLGVMLGNNCYCYATNTPFGIAADPGTGSGFRLTVESITCDSIRHATRWDGLSSVSGFSAPVTDGYYAALVIMPPSGTDTGDYHLYRQDATGYWSHKPGNARARNTDYSGKSITDPRTCNMGPYRFCSYLKVTPGRMMIR